MSLLIVTFLLLVMFSCFASQVIFSSVLHIAMFLWASGFCYLPLKSVGFCYGGQLLYLQISFMLQRFVFKLLRWVSSSSHSRVRVSLLRPGLSGSQNKRLRCSTRSVFSGRWELRHLLILWDFWILARLTAPGSGYLLDFSEAPSVQISLASSQRL